jgi:hypothetical protein
VVRGGRGCCGTKVRRRELRRTGGWLKAEWQEREREREWENYRIKVEGEGRVVREWWVHKLRVV